MRFVPSNLAKCFVTKELMRWPGIESLYGPHLRPTTIFSSDKIWEDLHTRVIEHVRHTSSPSIERSLMLMLVRSPFSEHSSHCGILHPDHPPSSHLPPRSHSSASRRSPLAAGRVGHCLGTNRQTSRDHKLSTNKGRGGCDERLELRHAEIAEFGRKGVDGGECCSGGGWKDKSMRD